MRKRNRQSDRFDAWWHRADRAMRAAVLILAAALLLLQTALQAPAIRSLLTPADRFEGVPYSPDPGR